MRSFVILAALLLGACAPSPRAGAAPADVTLTARPAATPAERSVTLVLANGTTQSVGYNLCPTAIEHRSGRSWVELPVDRICTMELRILQPGSEATYRMELPATLSAGEYRFSAAVELLDTHERRTVHSGVVRVG
jgi:hypothetical protein